MANPEVITIQGRPPTPNRNNQIPPPPPNHHRPPPPPGGYMPPRIINAAPHPADGHHVQRPPQQPHQHHPPPLVFQHDPPVRISDIRKERITDDQAREELSLYRIFRIEPSQTASDYDDGEDVRRGPNWERAFVYETRGVSKKEAARQVRHLNQSTWPVGDKKATLGGAEQRQLEKILEELQAHDHPCYQTNLVQINHQLRPKPKDKHDKHDRHHHKGGSKYYKDYREIFRDHKRRKKSSSSKDKKKEKARPQERASLTAYYKMSPKPELDALFMYHQREHLLRRMVVPLPPQHQAPPEGGHHHGHEEGQGKGGGGGGGGGGFFGKGGGGGGKVATVVQPGEGKRGGGHARPGSPMSITSDSDRSFFSETFSATDNMSNTTPDSDNFSQGSPRRGSFHRHRPRKERQYRLEAPRHFGIRTHRDLRTTNEHRISDEFALPLQQLIPPAITVEQIRVNAYEAGRADERADVQQIADKIAIATVSAVKQPRPPPRILQHRPSIRLVRPGEISHEEATLERLERLDMREEALEEARQTLPAGRRGAQLRRDEFWEEDRPRRRPLDDAVDYMRRVDAAAEIPFMENPFTPMPDRGRRVSMADPYSEFGRHGDFDDGY